VAAYTRNLKQDATYWPPGTNDGFGGVSFGAAAPIKCRWEDKAELFRNAQGQEVTSSAVVYVDRVLAIKGKLALGTFAGTPPVTAREIRQVGGSPNLKAARDLNKVWL